jgi:Tol biopolymer transport system component
MKFSTISFSAFCFVISFEENVHAQLTQRASLGIFGQAGADSDSPSITADGRYVAFASYANNLVSDDTAGCTDIFVRDLWTATTERVSVSTAGVQADNLCDLPSISGDGRIVVFQSAASNLALPATQSNQVFVRDRLNGTTELASVSSNGVAANAKSEHPCISADGRYVAFQSYAGSLAPNGTDGQSAIYVRDLVHGTTERVNLSTQGVESDGESFLPAISADGRFVAFESLADNLVPGDTNGQTDIFLRDRATGTTERANVSSASVQTNGHSGWCSISADGRYVAFASTASNLVAGDTNGTYDVFVRDRSSGTTEIVSVSTAGAVGNAPSLRPTISADGRCVAFISSASNLVAGDTNGTFDVFVRDRLSGTTVRASVASDGTQGNGSCNGGLTGPPSMTSDGRLVAFQSLADNLVANDTNATWDIFLRDRNASGFTSVCDAGLGGVIACPCSNPPSAPGRGCDNSAATGGAMLTASGVAYLSMDALVFTTSGEKPTATSTLWQGTALSPNGIVYGQGVRCANANLKRLFVKEAIGGSITAPDFGAGDPTISARSAAKGDPIQPGQSRWYWVSYRDPFVLGGCSSASTFNGTQTARIDWSH